ncbi:amino acid adenylation domain-containing protein [Lysobacter sp. K5869]|uniref:non-ribosomal peptide synthetase n=1 Tax=Lysobacter sp. K5869 TaxID=2820808 RepID=UPI001C063B01|nr:non-ribosomal peptide synthetase [Lysobacter sp. K5869]QWP75371.1 amino acid adenylation domain-containing protein [Lysobacter sp. K5869]
MRVAEIVALLNAEGVFPFLDQGRLKTRSATADLSARAVALLRENRDALIAFLGEDAAAAAGEAIAARARPQDPAPLSFAQRRLWFLHQLDPAASAAYHVAAALRLRGELDLDALRRTLARIVERHQALRTCFVDGGDGGEALQRVLPAQTPALPLFDLRGGDAQARVWEHLEAESREPFDLAAAGPLRLRLLRTGEDEHVLAVTMHHIVSDGWSSAVLVRELGAIYAATAAGQADPLPPPPIQYADYAAWQRERLDEARLLAETEYWKTHLAGAPALLELPADRVRPPRQSYAGERVPVRIDADTSAALRELAARHRATPFMVLLAGWAALLQRLSGQDSVVIGCPVANRQSAQVEPLIGFFANTMPLHVRLDERPSVGELLHRVKELTLEGYAHQNVPFENIVDALRPQRSLSHSPLFQASLTVSGAGARLPQLQGLQVEALAPPRHTAQFDLALALSEDAEGFAGELVYARDLFDRATVERWLGHFACLLRAMAADDRVEVAALPLLTPPQREAMLALGAGEPVAGEPEPALAAIERQLRERPDALAVIAGAVRWSRAELGRAADAVAAALHAAGVGAGDRVALLLDRDAWVPAAMLGVWKVGAAYVPLDPAAPPARIGAILADAQPRAVLAARAQALDGVALPAGAAAIALDALDASHPRDLPASAATDAGLAYLIYTSGSTGVPKGVAVGHSALAHYLDRARSLYAAERFGAGVVATPLAFDATVTSLILPLAVGRAVQLLPADAQASLDALCALLGGAEPLLFKLTPAHLDALAHLAQAPATAAHCVVVGGEALSTATLTRFRERVAPNTTLVNEYGPTETTVGCASFVVAPGDAPPAEEGVPIGRPFAGLRIDVLDECGEPVPTGVRGHLHIAGPQLADGYLGRADQGGFLRSDDGSRRYRSGDLACWGEDGRLRYLGRGDAQLKIRGYRVEPGEIEARLSALPGVLDAAAVAVGAGDARRLIAYAVSADGAPALDDAALRAALAAHLPHYMLPEAVVWIARMPLTGNGKRDLSALPAWNPAAAGAATEAPPRTDSERALHDSWCAILGRERIGIDEDFFALGGHSLLATRAVADIGRRLGKSVALRAVFEHPTVRTLAAHVDEFGEERVELLPRAPGVAPAMSHAQKRLWILDQVEGGSRQYHIASALRLSGELDPAACRVALDGLLARHEVLRTRFLAGHGDGECAVAESVEAPLRVEDLRGIAAELREAQLVERVRAEVARAFDLSSDALLRAALFRVDEREWVAVLTVHHIASDGGSSALLVAEFAERYAAAATGREPALAPLPVQYGDYALWQRKVLDEARLQRGLAHWRERLDGAPPVHSLPLDRPYPAQRDFSGGRVSRRLDAGLSSRLRELARTRAATPFMLLHAAFAAVLARWSGEGDIVVGSPVSGRAHPATENLIGCFVNSVAIRTRVEDAADFDGLLAQARASVLDALAHQAIPFDLVVEAVNPPRSLGHAPVFQISFTMHQDELAGLDLPGLRLGGLDAGTDVSRFDLELHARDLGDGFDLTLLYAAELFEADTIERLGDALCHWLDAAIARPDAPLSALPAMSAAEAARVRALGAPVAVARPALCAHELFEEQVRRQPDAPALAFDGETWSYAELDRRAARIAAFLRAQDLGPGARVGLCMERSHDLIAGLLAVLKAGAAYVPLDPTYPAERLAAMLEDAEPALVLTQESVLEALPALSEQTAIPVDGALAQALFGDDADEPAAFADSGVGPQHPAYVVFTSGSTGRPKGVVVPHRGLVNLALSQRELYDVGPGDRVLAFASVSFDGAVWEWAMALANGAALHLCDEDDRRSPARLARLLGREGITHAAIPPALLAQFDALTTPAPRVLFVAGEACDERLAWRWAQRCRVVNSYGPSEASVAATSAEVNVDRPLTLGRALPNVELQVLDAHGAPVPAGVAGELCIGGRGLADGYLGNAELTARSFLEGRAADGGRLYRSGDRVRWNARGELEFLGRVDGQVKIRGHRVEPGEIAAALRGHAGVAEALVMVRGEGALRRLVAYVVATPTPDEEEVNETLLTKALRERIKQRLPDYMMPAAFVVLDELPLTANGKVDLRRLPEPDYQAQASHVAPRDERERALAAIWQDVLRLEQVGAHDNFFEIGGDSILAIQAVSRANQAGLAITTRHLFVAQTVAELAALAATLDAPVRHAPQQASEGDQTLLPVHRLLIGLDEVDRHHYNQAVLLITPADFDERALEAVVDAVYRRHDALRLRFAPNPSAGEGAWRGWYQPLDAAMLADTLVRERLPEHADDAQTAAFVTERCNHWQRGFDLERGPLLRVVHFAPARAGERGRLLLLAQHFVVDGVSWRVLLADVERAYAQAAAGETPALEAKTDSFQHWGEALTDYAGSQQLAAQKTFWLEQCRRDVAPWTSDFGDASGDVGLMSDNALVSASLELDHTRALQHDCAGAYRTQINELLLAGAYLGLRAWSGHAAFRLRMEGHGREDLFDGVDLTQTMGYFTSIYPLVIESGSDDPGEAIKAIKEQYRAVPQHGIGFGIARHLGDDAELAAAADALGPPDLEFNYLGQFDQVLNADTAFQAAPESVGDKVGPRRKRVRRIGLTGRIFGGRLSLALDYSRTQYRAETVQALADAMIDGLRRVVAHCLAPGAGARTPSDFPLARADQARLDQWQSRYGAIARLYPATPMQAGLHFHSQLERSAYVVQSYPTLHGPLDVAEFRAAWDHTVARHDILRTAFDEAGGTLHQIVLERAELPWREHDWRGLDEAEQETRFAEFLAEDRAAGFDFAQAPLLRLSLFRLGEDRYRVLWTQHHITLDGWSGPLVYRDVLERYVARTEGRADTLAAPPVYGDYIAWLARQDAEAARAYWRGALAGLSLPTPLGFDRSPGDGHGHRERRVRLSETATRSLEALAQRLKITVNTLLQWSWGYVLHRYSGQNEVVFGTTLSGRPAEVAGIEAMVGLFIQTVPVAVRFGREPDLAAMLAALHAEFAESTQHGFLPLPQIQREAGGQPLFDSLLVFENLPSDARDQAAALPGRLRIERDSAPQFTHYRLTLIAVQEQALLLRLGYRAEHFAEDVIERLAAHLTRVLEDLPAALAARREPQLYGETELAQLQRWNDTGAAYPDTSSLADLFQAQAARTPDAVAVQAGATQLSYAELDARANRLAHGLRERGVADEARVAIVAPRGVEMLVAMLAVLKAGGAYVPIDPLQPEERVRLLIADAGAAAVLAGSGVRADAGWLPLAEDAWAQNPAHAPERAPATGRELAYVMYTSGSTGRPKGVMIEHRSIARLVIGSDYALLSSDDRVAHCSNPAFDASTWEIWAAWLHGARVVAIDHDTVLDAPALRDELLRTGVTAMWMTVGLFNAYVDELGPAFARLRHLLVGGDALDPRKIAALAQSPFAPARLVNGYGPTESTTFALTHAIAAPVDGERSIPIGRPIANTRAHLLDARMRPVPLGAVGELWIGGDGLARGYLNQPELSAERFVDDAGLGRLYRSGDLGRRLPDGSIEFVGRDDAQIKLRGFRIEPGEIEAALAALPGVRQALALALDDARGDKQLVAYAVAAADFDPIQARRSLAANLPDYLVPAAIVPLAQLPLTANGKVDRAALPAPDWSLQADDEPPRTETEARVHRIWCEVLERDSVGTRRTFFDAGGHSLLATRVVAAVRVEFGCELRIADLFARSTIVELAAWIDALLAAGAHAAAEPAEHDDAMETTQW